MSLEKDWNLKLDRNWVCIWVEVDLNDGLLDEIELIYEGS